MRDSTRAFLFMALNVIVTALNLYVAIAFHSHTNMYLAGFTTMAAIFYLAEFVNAKGREG